MRFSLLIEIPSRYRVFHVSAKGIQLEILHMCTQEFARISLSTANPAVQKPRSILKKRKRRNVFQRKRTFPILLQKRVDIVYILESYRIRIVKNFQIFISINLYVLLVKFECLNECFQLYL